MRSGSIILVLEDKTQRPADINEYGQAMLQGIPLKFKYKQAEVKASSDGYKPVSKTVILDEIAITVTLNKQATGRRTTSIDDILNRPQ